MTQATGVEWGPMNEKLMSPLMWDKILNFPLPTCWPASKVYFTVTRARGSILYMYHSPSHEWLGIMFPDGELCFDSKVYRMS